jgi:hypothetical protein
VEGQTKIENEIEKAERCETLKQMLLRLLDDPQVKQKIATLVNHQLPQTRAG